MIHTLDVSSQRLINILKILLQEKEWVTPKNISDSLGVSEKTVNDDLKFIKDSWGDIVDIQTSYSLGIKATNISVSTFIKIQSQILLDSIPIKFLRVLMFYPYETLNDYADRLHVSRSTLYRYIPKINAALSKYNISIERNMSSYFLYSEDELHIRRFTTIFFVDICGYNNLGFMTDEQTAWLRGRVTRLFKHAKLTITELHLYYGMVFYFVSILRAKEGFLLENAIIPIHYAAPDKNELTEFKQLFNVSEVAAIPNIEGAILGQRAKTSAIKSDYNIAFKIEELLECWLQKMRIFNYDHELKVISSFIEDIYFNDKVYHIPLHFFYSRFDFFAEETKLINPSLYHNVLKMTQQLSKLTYVDFVPHISFITYQLMINFPELINTRLNKQVLIISNHSEKHARFMAKTVAAHLHLAPSAKSDFTCISKNQLSETNIEAFNILVTNSATVAKEHMCLLINDFPTESNAQNIKDLLNTI